MAENVYFRTLSASERIEKERAIRNIERKLQAKADRKVRDLQREQDRELKELTKWAI